MIRAVIRQRDLSIVIHLIETFMVVLKKVPIFLAHELWTLQVKSAVFIIIKNVDRRVLTMVVVNYRFWKYVRRNMVAQRRKNVHITQRSQTRVFVIQTKAPMSERIVVQSGIRPVRRGVHC